VAGVEQRIEELRSSIESMQAARQNESGETWAALNSIEQQVREIIGSLQSMQASQVTDTDRIWTALSALAGLDGLATGVAEIGELLAPLRFMVPPTTADPLGPGIAEALANIRNALSDRRETNFLGMTTDWDGAVRGIGQVDPSAQQYTTVRGAGT